LGRTQIANAEIEPRLYLPVGVLGKADRARLGDAFQPRGNVDAVTHQVAVALLDHFAEMNADAELDPPLWRKARVALNHADLHFDGAAHRIDYAAELDDGTIAGALNHPPIMDGDYRVDSVAAERPQPCKDSILVGASKPAVPDDIRHQNCRELPGPSRGFAPSQELN